MRYRCFCMTHDDRIITGAFVEADSAFEARAAAEVMWRSIRGFHHAQVWLGRILLSSRPSPYQSVTPRDV
jgi:hypothetical protein